MSNTKETSGNVSWGSFQIDDFSRASTGVWTKEIQGDPNRNWEGQLPEQDNLPELKSRVQAHVRNSDYDRDLIALRKKEGDTPDVRATQASESGLCEKVYAKLRGQVKWSRDFDEAEEEKIAFCSLVLRTILEEVAKLPLGVELQKLEACSA